MARPQTIKYDLPLIIAKLNEKKSKSQVAREIGITKESICSHLRQLEKSGKICCLSRWIINE